jgi:hypothetical protein
MNVEKTWSHPSYNIYFPKDGNIITRSFYFFFNRSLDQPDFIKTTPLNKSLGKYRDFAAKVLFFPLGLYCATRFVAQRITMTCLYPAQSDLALKIMKNNNTVDFTKPTQKEDRKCIIDSLRIDGYIVKELKLVKNGVNYSGVLVATPQTINNGKWILRANGNMGFVESALQTAKTYQESGFNTLMVDPPNLGDSEGRSTPETMGEAQELGLCYLEEAIKANMIVLCGFSIGVAALNQAINTHTFKRDINYVSICEMSFTKLTTLANEFVREGAFRGINIVLEKYVNETILLTTSTMISKTIGYGCLKAVQFTGFEVDGIEASRKLASLNIPQFIIQSANENFRGYFEGQTFFDMKDRFVFDGILPKEACYAYGLAEERLSAFVIGLKDVGHNDLEEIKETTNQILHLLSDH